ncbi:hypothetical protein R3P38DRAFT_2638782 [Favolaschia claudopus]|uniref:Uncharacterized protein n=1 Tax=Favolaschia claudopus TaxID=2862362 RepID=A0AAW0AMI8_9AGAR
MLFNLATNFIAAALVVAGIVHGDIIAWSGDSCNGAEGGNVACDATCIGFEGRHSFEVVSGGSHCVTMFVGQNCDGQAFAFGPETAGNCINVNTGTPIQTFRCSPDTSCHFSLQSNGYVSRAFTESDVN